MSEMPTITEEMLAQLKDIAEAIGVESLEEALSLSLEMAWQYSQPDEELPPEEIAEIRRRCEEIDNGTAKMIEMGDPEEFTEMIMARARARLAEKSAVSNA